MIIMITVSRLHPTERRQRERRLARRVRRMLSGNPTEGVYSMYVSTIAVETQR
ncbi:MAG: hypothetical protein HGB18_04565 [Candidatus Moranbacteria bacterium]|nr:hypothetical protein [Candidatus Moranbacteria bacterium]